MAENEQTIDDFQQYLQKKVDQELENENESKNNVEEQKNEKNDEYEQSDQDEELEEEEDEESFQSGDESESDMSEYDEDEEDEDDKALMDLLLKQILACHKKKKKQRFK